MCCSGSHCLLRRNGGTESAWSQMVALKAEMLHSDSHSFFFREITNKKKELKCKKLVNSGVV